MSDFGDNDNDMGVYVLLKMQHPRALTRLLRLRRNAEPGTRG